MIHCGFCRRHIDHNHAVELFALLKVLQVGFQASDCLRNRFSLKLFGLRTRQ